MGLKKLNLSNWTLLLVTLLCITACSGPGGENSDLGKPIQFTLSAAFSEGDHILGESPGNYPPNSIVLPGDSTLFVEYVSCRFVPLSGQQADIHLIAVEERVSDENRVAMRPYQLAFKKVATIGSPSFSQPRDHLVTNEQIQFCIGPGCNHITSQFRWKSTLELSGRRNATTGFARVDCVVYGRLQPSQ